MKAWLETRTVRLSFAVALTFATGIVLLGPSIGFGSLFAALEDWGKLGPFGNLVGGLMNPIISTFALVWLVKGVSLQRKELSVAEADRRAQQKIAALTTLIDAHTNDIANRREHLAFLASQMTGQGARPVVSMRGKPLDPGELAVLISNRNLGISTRQKERVRYAGELRRLLHAARKTGDDDFRDAEVEIDDDGAP